MKWNWKKPSKPQLNSRTSLTLLFSLVIFMILLSAVLLAVLSVYIFIWTGVIVEADEQINVANVVLIMVLVSLVLGWVISLFASKVPLKPVNSLINRMNSLAAGDFSVRLQFGKAVSNYSAFNELSESFNTLAEELEKTEMLRSDFINNFSHEVKTPIVSISGFAKLLKRGNLTEEQRIQYLTAIEEESRRLSDMATNVLNLAKVENQAILTDLCEFNLSEQLRSSVLLLEGKWSNKDLNLVLDFPEYTLEANEELLRHVWINLLDNAIKFTEPRGTVSVAIKDIGDELAVSVSNTGKEIAPEKLERIFNKFYQADESHATEGNGIGLAVVKRVVELHSGSVEVISANGLTTFTVSLPKQQAQ